jgi:hypothetical protein
MHYIHDRYGVAIALGLSNVSQVKRYKNNALKAGLQPSKVIGGVELFDISILLNINIKIQANNHGYKVAELNRFKEGLLF